MDRHRVAKLVREVQTDHSRVGVERIECHRHSSHRIVSYDHGLRRPELVLKRCFDIRVNQKLHGRSKAIASGAECCVEGRSRIGRIRDQPVNAVRRGIHAVVAHHHHHPGISEPFDVRKTSAECGGGSLHKTSRLYLAQALQGNQGAASIAETIRNLLLPLEAGR